MDTTSPKDDSIPTTNNSKDMEQRFAELIKMFLEHPEDEDRYVEAPKSATQADLIRLERRMPRPISITPGEGENVMHSYASSTAAAVTPDRSPCSILSDKAIERYRQHGEVVIEPFDKSNLATSSYNVTLGPYYYRVKLSKLDVSHPTLGRFDGPHGIYNPFSEVDVAGTWMGPMNASTHRIFFPINPALKWHDGYESNTQLKGILPSESIIWIHPGETILAHTNEFIGGRTHVTTMIKARSSWGRSFIEVCKCAGWGDVGYFNRWTMEITNNSQYYKIPLVVGRPIAQIVFCDTEGINSETYNKNGKYQTSSDLATLMANWNPSMMLPKLYKDPLPVVVTAPSPSPNEEDEDCKPKIFKRADGSKR